MKRFDGTEIPAEEAAKFRKFVDTHRWIFAKTYAAFCPHEYSLRKYCKDEDFVEFVKFIWRNGFFAMWGKNKSKYFIDEEGGWYYFVFPVDIDENGNVLNTMTLINRGSLGQWEIVEEETMFGKEFKCKRLPKERRRPVSP